MVFPILPSRTLVTWRISSSGTYIGGRELDMIVPLGVVTLELPERPRTEDVRIMRWPLRGTCRDTPPVLTKKNTVYTKRYIDPRCTSHNSISFNTSKSSFWNENFGQKIINMLKNNEFSKLTLYYHAKVLTKWEKKRHFVTSYLIRALEISSEKKQSLII